MRQLLLLGCVLGLFGLAVACSAQASATEQYERGVAALNAGKPSAARTDFTAALTQDPSLLEAHLNLAVLDLQAGHADAALTRLDALKQADSSDDPRIAYAHAMALLATNQLHDARLELKRLTDREFPEAWYAMGALDDEAGDQAAAAGAFKRYLALRPTGGFSEVSRTMLAQLAEGISTDLAHEAATAIDATPPPSAPPTTAASPVPLVFKPPVDAATTPPEPTPVVPAVAPAAPKPIRASLKPKRPATVKTPSISAVERVWRDARFLEVRRHSYSAALTAYREYLAKDPLGPHATGAQEGIVRCEAELRKVGK